MPPFYKTLLLQARTHAQSGRFSQMLNACEQIVGLQGKNDLDSASALLDVGTLLLNFGFLARPSHCFEQVRALASTDLRPQMNLANLAREAGDPAVTDAERLQGARAWGDWASLPELAAPDADGYVDIARSLAALRAGLRVHAGVGLDGACALYPSAGAHRVPVVHLHCRIHFNNPGHARQHLGTRRPERSKAAYA